MRKLSIVGFIAILCLGTAWGQPQSSPSLASLEERIRQLEDAVHMPETISRQATSSVGLIVGQYIWTDRTGRKPLRYQGTDQSGNYLSDKDGKELVTFDGDGAFVTREFQGTGFLIDSRHLLTSGFVLSPWYNDPLLDESENPEIMPSLQTLHVYFPGVAKPLNIKLDRADEAGDGVVCVIEGTPLSAPALSLSQSEKVQTGEQIVLLGYPGGVELLATTISEDLRREMYKFGKPTLDEAAEMLAEHGYIRPVAMQTRVSGHADNHIFFETFNNYGNTGGPLIDSTGKVVGMSQAINSDHPYFNMAVSVAPMRSWILSVVSD